MQFFMVTPDSFLKDTALFLWMAPVDPVLPDLLQSLSLSSQGKAITCPSKPQVVSVQLQADLQHWGGAGWLHCCHSLAEVTTIVLLHGSQELRNVLSLRHSITCYNPLRAASCLAKMDSDQMRDRTAINDVMGVWRSMFCRKILPPYSE
jgi:hypothetical protein